MQTYAVPFEIVGKLTIEAASAAEAQRIVEAMSLRDIASEGELESFDPQPVKEDN